MGSGGGSTSSGTNTFTPPLWTQNQWPDFVQAASTIAQQPQQLYQGQRIAGINNSQAQGLQYLSDLSGNMSPDMQAMRQNLQITASGGYEDPYASAMTLIPDNKYVGQHASWDVNPFIGQNATDSLSASNPYVGGTTQVGSNPYAGMSDQYNAMKQASMDDVVRNYQNAVAPGTDAAFNRAGAFHSGAYDAAQSANKYDLAKNLANMSSSMDVGQWDKSAGLAQQNIGLGVQAQQGDLSRNVQGYQNWQDLMNQSGQQDLARNTSAEQAWLNMMNQSSQQDLARNAGLAQQGIQMGVDAQNNDLNRASGAWQQERNRQIGAFQPILQANQFDQNNARNMIGIGDTQRGYTQDLLNSDLQDWQNQVNYPTQMLNLFGGALSQASGNYGQNSQVSNLPMYQANPFASALGAGLLGAGVYNSWGSS